MYDRIIFYAETYYIWCDKHGLPQGDDFFTEWLGDPLASSITDGLKGCFVPVGNEVTKEQIGVVFAKQCEKLINELTNTERAVFTYDRNNSTFLVSDGGVTVLDKVTRFPIGVINVDPDNLSLVIKFSTLDADVSAHMKNIDEFLDDVDTLKAIELYWVANQPIKPGKMN